jgi:glycosyltransferase involved in cell wall biosynthesis
LRILLINHEYTISGASRLMFRLALHLREGGHSCDVMSILSRHGPLREHYAAHGFRHLGTAEFTAYDVVICNTIYSLPIVSPAASFTRVVWWIHEGENGLEYVFGMPPGPRAFQDATAIVFQTTFQRDSIYRSFVFRRRPGGLFVIPNGLHVEAAGPGIPKTQPFRIVSIGAIDGRKRHGDLIRAVAALGREDVDCVILGKYYNLDERAIRIVTARPDLFKMLEASNDDVLAWLRSADLFCLASEVESQPLAILEAALVGKPLVITDLPCYEGIWRDRQNCLLVPVGDIGGLSNAMATLLSSAKLRAELGSAARATASQFTEAAFLARLDAMLEQIQ